MLATTSRIHGHSPTSASTERRVRSAPGGAWFLAEEVTTRGSFPDSQLLLIGTGDHDDACRSGFALPIWFKEGRESWDGGGWKAEGGPHAGQMLCYNVFEEAEWTVGVPTRPPCQPDESGITWIPVSSLE